ncbi:MAG: hypothetical protein KDC98_22225 [Planctomycetes bacterium]|nr:hypothetical protein [Planctomycetota bacterium]
MNKKLEFTADRTLLRTKDITPPDVKAKVTFTFKVDDATEQAIHDYYKKNAQKFLDDKLDGRLAGFVDPIADAQKKFDSLRANAGQLLDRVPSMLDAAEISAHKKAIDDAQSAAKRFEEFLPTVNALLKNAVASIEKKEIDVWFKEFEAKAVAACAKGKKAKDRKEVICVAKVVLVGVFVLGTAAVGIIASFATLNPGPIALAGAVIGAVVSGGSAMHSSYKLYKKDWPNEERTIKKIEADLVALGDMAKQMRDKHIASLKKHLVELSGYRADRAKALVNYDSHVKKAKVEVDKLWKVAAETGDPKAASKCSNFLGYHDKLVKERSSLESADSAAQGVVDRASKFVKDFEGIEATAIAKDVKEAGEKVGSAFVKFSGFCADLAEWYDGLK